jgi:hypothetical protein
VSFVDGLDLFKEITVINRLNPDPLNLCS